MKKQSYNKLSQIVFIKTIVIRFLKAQNDRFQKRLTTLSVTSFASGSWGLSNKIQDIYQHEKITN